MEESTVLRTFMYENASYETEYTKKFEKRQPYAPHNPKKVAAFIPGTIMKVFVKEKDKVKKGDAMVVLQAMKMNNHILAPITGVIKKIHVKQTDNVAKNQILVEFR